MKKFFKIFLVPLVGWSSLFAVFFCVLLAFSSTSEDKSRGENEREGCEDYCRDVGGFLVEIRAGLYAPEDAVCVCVIDEEE